LKSSQIHYASPVRSTYGLLEFLWAKTLFQTQFILHDTQNASNGAVTRVSAGKGPHVLDGQFLQLISSGSKAKSLNTDCVGTLQLNRKDIPQTLEKKKL